MPNARVNEFISNEISKNSEIFERIIEEVKESYEKHFGTSSFSESFIKTNEFKEKLENYKGKILMKINFAFEEDPNCIDFIDSTKEFNYKIMSFLPFSLESTLYFDSYKDATRFLDHYIPSKTRDSNDLIIFVEGNNVFNYFRK